MVTKYKPTEEVIEDGIGKGILMVRDGKVTYKATKKSYKIDDPEEKVRASFYVELIEKYKYPKERIDTEVIVPRREPTDKADIVVYEDDEWKKPYIVVECKRDGISQAEIKQAIEQVFGNANSLRSKYAILVAGNVRIAFDVANFPSEEREKNVIADIPIRYGKVIKFKYKKGDPEWDLKEVTRNELLAKFQQCHDTLWEGGKRNPAEAFDEMSKLMFCKVHDERFLTKKGERYNFQVATYETIKEVAERIRKIYEEAHKIDPLVFEEPIKAENAIIYNVVEILQGISLSKTDLDAKGVAFEHFLGAVFRGEMGQYFTPRPIVEFMVEFLDPTEKDLVIDPACGSGGFLIYTIDKVRKLLYENLEEKDAEARWYDFAKYQVYGVEINSQLSRVAMMNMILHEDGHSNIENNDALDDPSKFDPRRDIKLGKYNLLLTNPPFGAVIKENEKSYLRKYELGGKIKRRNRQNTEILFIERCLDFLKPSGRMGIVLPDGILTNSSLQYVRDFITERAQILGVISLPQGAFSHYGAGVKASLLFLRKRKGGEKLSDKYPIFMATAEHIGYDTTGRPDKNEFQEILTEWKKFREEKRLDFFHKAPLCFAIGRGEVEGRIDANYYAGIKQYGKDYKNLAFLKDAAIINPKRRIKVDANGSVPYIGLPDTTEEGKVVNINVRPYKEVKGRNVVLEGDILFARIEPSIYNKKYVFVEDLKGNDFALTSTEFYVVEAKEDINKRFLFWLLRSNLVYNQVFGKVIGTTGRRRLDIKTFKNFRIPLPPTSIQDKIANLMDKAYKQKKEKEQEAQKLLDSIEPYVLEELGIEMPKIEEKSPMVFNITADILKGGRLDPFYYLPKYEAIEEATRNGRYPIKELGEYISFIRYGCSVKNIYAEDGIPLLRIANLKSGEIDLSDVVKLPFEKEKDIGNACVEEGDFLISRSGTIGTVAIVPKEAHGYAYGSFMIKFKIKTDDMIPPYISILMNTSLVQEQIKRSKIGAIQGNITIPAIKSILLPSPPLKIQEKIAKEVQERREKAKKLRVEATRILEEAKDKVERMILEGK